MQISKLFYPGIFLISVIMITPGCHKDNTTTQIDVKTTSGSFIGQGWATLNGTVNAAGSQAIVSFEYDSTTTYKFEVPGNPDTITGNEVVYSRAGIQGLKPNKSYNFRIKVITPDGILYGSNATFTTSKTTKSYTVFNPSLTYGSVSDIDGHTSKTIKIGTQTWMAENLRSTKYNDGTNIPFLNYPSDWSQVSTSPGYSWYNNDSVDYGGLYNYYVISYAVNNNKNVCPAGWHVASDSEWGQLSDYLGGESVAGSKMKETGITHWTSPNSSATNVSGFTAIPSGYRSASGSYNGVTKNTYWWTSSEMSTTEAYCRTINSNFNSLEKTNSYKKTGLSIRCIKD